MRAVYRPLRWVGPATPAEERRSKWTFKAKWANTCDLLDVELAYLEAEDLVIEADFRECDIRIDGMPRGNARNPVFPGVRIFFDSKFGPLCYSTDSCVLWQHNIRSIALGLTALRAVDRYGVTKRGEQYTGWKAITAGPAPSASAKRAAAAYFLSHHGGTAGDHTKILTDHEYATKAYRAAARKLHPDTDGSPELFQQLQDAAKALGMT